MVESAEKIYLMDREFIFIKKMGERYFYKHVDNETEAVDVIEIQFSRQNKKITRMDYYKLDNDEVVESMNIIRGIDGITEVDYYPTKPEIISIDGNRGSYNISIYKTYFESLEKACEEVHEIELVKRGHCRHKLMLNTCIYNDIFKSKENYEHRVKSPSIDKLRGYTETISSSIKNLEEALYDFEPKKVAKPEKVIQESLKVELTPEDLEEIEEEIVSGQNGKTIEDYPKELYIYDRSYYIVGFKKNTVVYRNTIENIRDLEVMIDDFDNIKEIRFVEYNKDDKKEVGRKIRIIRMKINKDNEIIATLCNRKKESVLINSVKKEKALVKASLKINEKGTLEDSNVDINTDEEKFFLKASKENVHLFVDQQNNPQTLLSHSFIDFKSITTYSRGILRNITENFMLKSKKDKLLVK